MDTWRIEYSKEFAPGELTDWVNEALDQGQDEEGVKKGSRGYAQIVVEVGGEQIRFAALNELRFLLEALAEKDIHSEQWFKNLPRHAFTEDQEELTHRFLAKTYKDLRGTIT